MKSLQKKDFPVVATWNSVKKIDKDLYKAERWARAIYRTCREEVSKENIIKAERICGYKTSEILNKIYVLLPFWLYDKKFAIMPLIK